MQQAGSQGFGEHTSPGGKGGRGGQQKTSNINAVTIKQLSAIVPDPAGDGFRFPSGREVSAVRIVARIQEVFDEVSSTHTVHI